MAIGQCLPPSPPPLVVGRRAFVVFRRRPLRLRSFFSCRAELKLAHQIRRKCAPLLENVSNSSNSELASTEWRAVPDIWRSSAAKFGDRVALVDPYHDPPSELTYKQLEQEILNFSEGLRMLGLVPDEKVALFSDNSSRWLIADQGIMTTGAINVVRGARSSDEELFQIYQHSGSVALVVENPVFLDRIVNSFISKVDIRFCILLWGDKPSISWEAASGFPLYDYEDVVRLGKKGRNDLLRSFKEGVQLQFDTIDSEDVATVMYTSGTGGTPKGVMLTHGNLLHQINNLWDFVPAKPGDRFLSMLPSWHAYERASEYFIFTNGVEQVYTNVKSLKEDLKRYQPQYIISVPLVYETLYSSIQRQISASSPTRNFVILQLIKISLIFMEAKNIYEGKVVSRDPQPPFIICIIDWIRAMIVAAFLWPLHTLAKKIVYSKILPLIGISKAGISGGGSLPMHVDKFFEAIGVKVQNGYGLTETSPVVAARTPSCNVLGTVGHPIKHTQVKIVDVVTGRTCPDGSKGIVKIKGPQVMKGYYKNPSATKAAIDEDGWFNSGDLGWIAPNHNIGRSRKCGGMLVLEGRAKDTIVLTTGENVEPAEIEAAACRSSLIHQIVVIGQDQRRLGAIIVPNNDAIRSALDLDDGKEVSKQVIKTMIYDEVKTWTAGCSFRIGPILIVDEPFTIENGLMTPTMKVRRDKVMAKYRDEILGLYK